MCPASLEDVDKSIKVLVVDDYALTRDMVKSIVRGSRLSTAAKLTEDIMRLRTEDEVEETVNRVMKEKFPLEFAEETS